MSDRLLLLKRFSHVGTWAFFFLTYLQTNTSATWFSKSASRYISQLSYQVAHMQESELNHVYNVTDKKSVS